MCIAIFSVNQIAIQGVMIQMFNHGINIIGLWVIVELIERKTGTRKLSELGGLARKAPALAIFFVVIALANIALPLTNAFIGEFLMFTGIFNSVATQYNIWLTVFAGICIILAAVYTLNMVRKVLYGTESVAVASVKDIRLNEKIALGVIVIFIFWIGVYAQPWLNMTDDVSAKITNDIIKRPEIIPYLRK
jgi:NADH-quinone oxidoreductase subunit M